jgi:hypothetical protein
MNAAEYKKATRVPDVFGAIDLEVTIQCLRATGSSLAERLACTTRTLIPKPSLHSCGPETNFVRIALPLAFVREIVSELLSAEAGAVSPKGETTPEASYLGSLVDRWGRYQHWLEERAV